MPEIINLIKNVEDIEVSPEFDIYNKVIININDEESAVASADNSGEEEERGRTLEISNPLFGSQAVANKMLARLQNSYFRYQPHNMRGAILDPASEVGDAVSANGVLGGIYNREREFGKLMRANVSAPAEEEIDHEYQFESPQDREVKRRFGDVRASILVQSDRIDLEVENRTNADSALSSRISQNATAIEARVTKTGGTEGSSNFWWKLTSSDWTVGSGSKTIFSVYKNSSTNKYEAKVEGNIVAKSGEIGGFTIGTSAIYKGIDKFNSTVTSSGVYIGTDGIRLGQNFKVSSSGALTASSGTFSGTVYAGRISYGGGAGTFSGDGLSNGSVGGGKITNGGVSKGKLTTGVQGKLDQVDENTSDIKTLKGYFTGAASFSRVDISSSLWLWGKQVATGSIKDGSGKTVSGVMFCL